MADTAGAAATTLWRRAIQALAHAFDLGAEADDQDTVFQTNKPARQDPRPARDDAADARADHRSQQTLQ